MSFDIGLIITNTISGILVNLPFLILFWVGFRLISREIKIGVQNVPSWLEQYFKLQRQQLVLEKAVRSKE